VDDFGTGYSSLANLRRLPIDQLKIDRSFVTPMLRDESDLIIVRSTINLGHDLGLQIIAEGVEDRPTLLQLAELGADLAQGYHLSRPLPVPAFDDWRGRAAA
jgi:EAL domain-containing protein (putative c-di-GMP-specific phosphodiesterase class I)